MTRASHHNPRYAAGSFGLSYHLEMLSDIERVDRCKNAILASFKDVGPEGVFCELGCGTGIFSIFAAKFFRKVYAVESDPVVYNVAKSQIIKLGLQDKITLIFGDAMTVPIIDEKIHVLFCEMMSIWLITEPQVKVIRRWLQEIESEVMHVIPHRVINIAELGQVDYFFDELEIKADLPQFSGIRPPRVMTESRVVHQVLLSQHKTLKDRVEKSCQYLALTGGILNCVRISSIVEFYPGVNFFSTDTLMPSTIVPLASEVSVEEGDIIELYASYEHRSELSDSRFEVVIRK